MRKVPKIITIIFSILAGIIVLFVLYVYFFMHEERPSGQDSPKAEQLAEKMSEAVNAKAWDTTRYVRFNSKGAK
ncbi:MAG: hypothetical protein ABEH43_03885 [Flavobacteriales bacterium]